MGLRSIVLYVLVGSTVVAWLSWSPLDSEPRIDIAGRCSTPTRQWAEAWGRAPARGWAVARVSVLCGADGRAYTAMLVFPRSADRPRLVAWHPVTTFFGTLEPRHVERVDILDQTGRLVEYATVDRRAERIEFHSPDSRFIGNGRLDVSSGWVERFSVEGVRAGRLVLPIPPDADLSGTADAASTRRARASVEGRESR